MDAKAGWLWQHFKIKLNRVELLQQAFTHRSVSGVTHNERLEFLGDAVLGLVIAQQLYEAVPALTEGEMSRARSALVNAETLAAIGHALKLPEQIEVGLGEVRNGGYSRTSVLADALEAIIGAIYLELGLAAAAQVIEQLFAARLPQVLAHLPDKDPKSALQEWCQARGLGLPCYTQIDMTDDGQQKRFTVRVEVVGLMESGVGEGTALKRAERVAAQNLLRRLENP
jgi:ribonuclease III